MAQDHWYLPDSHPPQPLWGKILSLPCKVEPKLAMHWIREREIELQVAGLHKSPLFTQNGILNLGHVVCAPASHTFPYTKQPDRLGQS